jgi:RNA polymerase sigma-70 factor (ECF subfamily)
LENCIIENIWRDFSGKLRQFIRNRVSDDFYVDEILQEVFISIHSNIDKLRDEEKISAWVYQIARNKIIDYYRLAAKKEGTVDIADYPDSAFEVDLTKEFSADIRDMMKNLPEKYEQALIMTEFENISQKKLAEILNISVSGAKSRVQRGRQMLKDLLMQCCHIEFDKYGNILDYHPHSCCCCSPKARS